MFSVIMMRFTMSLLHRGLCVRISSLERLVVIPRQNNALSGGNIRNYTTLWRGAIAASALLKGLPLSSSAASSPVPILVGRSVGKQCKGANCAPHVRCGSLLRAIAMFLVTQHCLLDKAV